MLRRLITVVGSAMGALMLTATAAFAGICYNASRSDTGNQHASQSQALGSAADFIAALNAVGCQDEATALKSALEGGGLDPANIVVNEKAVMGGGLLPDDPSEDPSPLSSDGQGIDHLLPYFPLILDAVECLPEEPGGGH